MKPTIRVARGPLVILLALLAALLIAACGGSSKPTGSTGKNAAATTTTKSASSSRTALASCLKQHGVTLGTRGAAGFRFRRGTSTTGTPPSGGFPGGGTPPAGAAGGGFPGGAAGFAGGNSKFAKAFTACRKQLGLKAGAGFGAGAGGRFGAGGGSGFAPRFSTAALKSYVSCIRRNGYAAMPEPKASGTGSFFPASVEKNAAFKTANKKCESVLLKALRAFRRPAGGGASGGTPTISGSSTSASA